MIHRSLSFAAVAAVVFRLIAHGAPGAGDAPRERVLFEDQFNGKLSDGWSWVYEDKANWRKR